ncbi:branched-chain amino acid transport system II carrier protein [Fructilactobacillus florum]|uniref:branched-chain amino acid transport system II carrier protein n=1 Tax=Fructilactobacillus florum TaxID=640331 RepID=UPI0020933B4F|nr:branched-chain amino acid transport system II carrier protein [Fructilactobacillus florum]
MTKLPLVSQPGQGTPSLISGFLEGYNTMDALAGLGFGVTIIAAMRVYLKQKQPPALEVVKVGMSAMGFEALIYVSLIALGALSLSYGKVSPDGGTAFTQIMQHYTGFFGSCSVSCPDLFSLFDDRRRSIDFLCSGFRQSLS